MKSFMASCAPSPASGVICSGGGAFALAMVCAPGGGGDAVERKRVWCLASAREKFEVTPSRLILDPATAWERRGVGSRLRSSLELAEENMLELVLGERSTMVMEGPADSGVSPLSFPHEMVFFLDLDFGSSIRILVRRRTKTDCLACLLHIC